MRQKMIEVRQGDVTDVFYARPDFDGIPDSFGTDWKCYIRVNDCDGNEVVETREVIDSTIDVNGKKRFVCYVKPSETELLDVPSGEEYVDFDWVIQIENLSYLPEFSKEDHIVIRVRRQGIIQGTP